MNSGRPVNDYTLAIEEWALSEAHQLHSLWAVATSAAPFCYAVDAESFATGIIPDEEDDESCATARDEKLIVAIGDSEPAGFAHLCTGLAEVNGADIECGIIRYLAFLPSMSAVGQQLLNHSERILQENGYRQIDAFPLYHGYAFHNHKVGILSRQLDYVAILLIDSGFEPHDAQLTLERRANTATCPDPPPEIQVGVERVHGAGIRPNIFVTACSGDDRIGTCRLFSCRTYAGSNELETCCYVRWLGVQEKYRRRGIGRHLLNRALYEMSCDGYDHTVLNCREKNVGALALYKKAGYATADVSSAYFKRI